MIDTPNLDPNEDFEAWQKYQAEHEISEEEREQLTAEVVEEENQEAPTEEV